MKNQSLWMGLAAAGLLTTMTGCSKPEAPAPTPAAAVEPAKPAAADDAAQKAADEQKAAALQKAADEQKVADAAKAAEAQKLLDAAAQKQAEADQALKQAAADKLAADQAAADKQSQMASGAAKVQTLIDSAKKLSTENKWSEVLQMLSQLAGEKLSPAQQSTVDGLKSSAVKQTAGAAAGNALGGLLDSKR